MIKRRLKYPYLFVLIGMILLPLMVMVSIPKTNLKDDVEEEYQTEEVMDYTLPVIDTTVRVINPYTDASVTIGKTYYDYQAEEQEQVKAIIQHENTYTQNTGIDYVNDHPFEVVSILNGTVITVKEDESIGKVVEVKHDNGDVSIYQSLSEIKVKKGDIITQGQLLGMSGENELGKDLGNHLHFEIYRKGQAINPESYIGTEVKYEKGN